ncbi:MAG: glycoside hydrolase family 43 protein, partial [Candidatus Promineifilaceae bacterium]
NPSFVGRRQQHKNFLAQTALAFTPQSSNECAGLVLLQNNDFHFRFIVTQEDESFVLRLIRRTAGDEEILAQRTFSSGLVHLRVAAHEQDYGFYAATSPAEWQPIAEAVDGRILSTPVAGGFVGCYIGMYASSNGQPSTNRAYFDSFDYRSLDEDG